MVVFEGSIQLLEAKETGISLVSIHDCDWKLCQLSNVDW